MDVPRNKNGLLAAVRIPREVVKEVIDRGEDRFHTPIRLKFVGDGARATEYIFPSGITQPNIAPIYDLEDATSVDHYAFWGENEMGDSFHVTVPRVKRDHPEFDYAWVKFERGTASTKLVFGQITGQPRFN